MNFENVISNKGNLIKGLVKILPKIHGDNRGFFQVTWNKNEWLSFLSKENNYLKKEFVQENHSRSRIGVLRGLHYQKEPYSQGKLIRCLYGSIYDVAVDLRKSSNTFGEWAAIELSSHNNIQFWIPEGFAHGFLTLSDGADVSYKVTDYWNKDAEKSIIWNDKDINIDWPLSNLEIINPSLSIKDNEGSLFADLTNEELFK